MQKKETEKMLEKATGDFVAAKLMEPEAVARIISAAPKDLVDEISNFSEYPDAHELIGSGGWAGLNQEKVKNLVLIARHSPVVDPAWFVSLPWRELETVRLTFGENPVVKQAGGKSMLFREFWDFMRDAYNSPVQRKTEALLGALVQIGLLEEEEELSLEFLDELEGAFDEEGNLRGYYDTLHNVVPLLELGEEVLIEKLREFLRIGDHLVLDKLMDHPNAKERFFETLGSELATFQGSHYDMAWELVERPHARRHPGIQEWLFSHWQNTGAATALAACMIEAEGERFLELWDLLWKQDPWGVNNSLEELSEEQLRSLGSERVQRLLTHESREIRKGALLRLADMADGLDLEGRESVEAREARKLA